MKAFSATKPISFSLGRTKHEFNKLIAISNVLQQDEIGYPLRLCIYECECGAFEQRWVDVHEGSLERLKTGDDVLCRWVPIE